MLTTLPGARLGHWAVTSGTLSFSDVNECNSSPCSQECANVYGSYQCYCRRGYQLSDVDGVTCEGEGAPLGRGEITHPLRLNALPGWWVVRVFPCPTEICLDTNKSLRVRFRK